MISSPVRPSKTLSPQRAHRGYLKYLTPAERTAVTELVARLRKKLRQHLVRVVFFGSKVRGDFEPESDIDLLVVFDPDDAAIRNAIYAQEREVALNYNVLLSVFAIDREQFQNMQKLRAPTYRHLRNEGYSLYPRVGKYSHIGLEVNGGVENVDNRKKIQIKHFVARAHEALDNARDCLDKGYLAGTANRAYYAVFYLSTAVLLVLDVVRAKHEGVKGAFGQYFVKTKRIEPEYSAILERALKLRLDADYAEEYKFLNTESATKIVADAAKFVARMERYLREVGALD